MWSDFYSDDEVSDELWLWGCSNTEYDRGESYKPYERIRNNSNAYYVRVCESSFKNKRWGSVPLLYFALGGTCEYEHKSLLYLKCSNCFTFFGERVRRFLGNTQILVSNKSKLIELQSMFWVVPKLIYAIAHYIAHWLRVKVQFADQKVKRRVEA